MGGRLGSRCGSALGSERKWPLFGKAGVRWSVPIATGQAAMFCSVSPAAGLTAGGSSFTSVSRSPGVLGPASAVLCWQVSSWHAAAAERAIGRAGVFCAGKGGAAGCQAGGGGHGAKHVGPPCCDRHRPANACFAEQRPLPLRAQSCSSRETMLTLLQSDRSAQLVLLARPPALDSAVWVAHRSGRGRR